MKQKLLINQNIRLSHYNMSSHQSLEILKQNANQLHNYLFEKAQDNPYLHYLDKDNNYNFLMESSYHQPSLEDTIMEQVILSNKHLNPLLCRILIARLNSNGYFTQNLSKLCKSINYDKNIIKNHLQILRTFEPIGCFCFCLKESLQVQCCLSEEASSETAYILCDYLEDIALKRFDDLVQKTQLEIDEIKEGITFLKSLNPKPAANYSNKSSCLVPEVQIKISNGKLSVEMINQDLSVEFKDFESTDQQLLVLRREALNILSSLQKRTLTIVQITNALCSIQYDFFFHHGPLVRCTLSQIAQMCSLHTSTVSRAIMGKSFEFEGQYYSFKDFFCQGGIDDLSEKEICKIIKDIIQNEDKCHPYSDEKIREILEIQGIYIARRTVTKYRNACFLFNASQRKQKS